MNENKTNINWYPGHMFKTKKELQNDISLTDLVIELLDARIPLSSRNPDIYLMTENKKRIIILNKKDLADSETNKKWKEYFSVEAPTLLLNSEENKEVKSVLNFIDQIMSEKVKKDQEKGIKFPIIRLMIVGVPNVGKSSFINRLANRKTMEVGDKPGVTKRKQWIRIDNNKELLDTPGILWPRFDSKETGLHLALVGSIKDGLVDEMDMSLKLLEHLILNYPDNLAKRYNIEEEVKSFIEDLNKNKNNESKFATISFNIFKNLSAIKLDKNKLYKLLLVIGYKKNVYRQNQEIDEERVCKMLIDDFRKGRLGRISLERPEGENV